MRSAYTTPQTTPHHTTKGDTKQAATIAELTEGRHS